MRAMTQKIPLILVAITFIFAGCDLVKDPVILVGSQYQDWEYGAPPEFTAATNEMIIQKILIEDFTGHECGNCPGAATLAAQLKTDHPDEVVVIGIHAGSLAHPEPPEFPSDFQTEAGELWFPELDFPVNPVGRINRSASLATSLFEFEWVDAVDAQLGLDPDAVIQIETEFIPSANHLNVHVFSELLSDVVGQVKMVLVITEDGLEGPQLDYDLVDDPDTPQNERIIEEYEFEHVMRGTINGSYGVIIGTDMAEGDTDLKSYTYEWPAEFNIGNCNVVAIVFAEQCLDGDGQPIEPCGRILNVLEVHLDA